MKCPNCGKEMKWVEKHYDKGNVFERDLYSHSNISCLIQLTISYYCYYCGCKLEVEYPHKKEEVQE